MIFFAHISDWFPKFIYIINNIIWRVYIYQIFFVILFYKKINIIKLSKLIKISDQLTSDEIPVVRDKNLKKVKKISLPTGAFHEKKDKNKKVQLGGKRRQEKQRRAMIKSIQKRK